MSDAGLFLFVGLALFTVVLAMIKDKIEDEQDRKSPVLSEPALIHAKSEERKSRYRVSYYLHFFIPDRDTVETCCVSESIYKYLSKGTRGTLTHQGSIFISFKVNDEIICSRTLRGTSLD